MSNPLSGNLTYIANARFPTEKANGLQVIRMCEAFQDQGVSTTLLHPARHQPGALKGVNLFEYYGVRTPFVVKTLSNVDISRTERWLPHEAFVVAHFAHSAAWAWYAARFASRLVPSDLFVTRDITVATALGLRRLPTVLELHKAPQRWSLRLLRDLVTKRRLRLLVTLTAALRETLISNNVDAKSALVLHDGVDLTRYAVIAERPWADSLPVVLYSGQLFGEKGIDTLVDAARLLAGDAEIKIVGGMPHHVKAWRERLEANGPANVEFLGHLSPERLPALQKGADVLALPNSGRHPHSARYTSPMKLFEYMAAGRPILASNVTSVGEVLRHGDNAWLVPADDPLAFAEGVRTLLLEHDLGERLASRARADVQEYTWDIRARRMLAEAGLGDDHRPRLRDPQPISH